ncbi:MAG TPA: copper homeostasis protein CutC [Candidatus Acidoferrum sp.]|nr:copper homeostasis protein CutC [Candidatus Acidoferrum sp.]
MAILCDDSAIAVLFRALVPYSPKSVKTELLLEISVQTVEAALAAERGGAGRIELCSALEAGGLTPSGGLMLTTRANVQIPVFAMIRPRGRDFVYTEGEFGEMKRAIEVAKGTEMDGVVLGVLKKDRGVDVARTRELVELAQPLPVTFHRAFDEARDLDVALESVIDTGAARILTSAGAATAPAGIEKLAQLVKAAKERIIILPGGGINASNALYVAKQTGARELHSGLGSVLAYGQEDYQRFESEVRKLAEQSA